MSMSDGTSTSSIDELVRKILVVIATLVLAAALLFMFFALTEARNHHELVAVLSLAHLDPMEGASSGRGFGFFVLGLALGNFAMGLFSALRAKSWFDWINAICWGLLGAIFLQTMTFHLPGA